MGFYGNVSNVGKTNMVFDKIYSSRADMVAHCDGDGVYAGRYVLIEYEQLSPDDTIYTIYAPASSSGTFNQAYADIDCTVLFEGAEKGAIYRLIRVDNGTITLNEYYFYDGQSYNSLAEFDGKTPSSQLPGGTSPEANYIINFNKDKLLYGNIRGYDSTVWMKTFYTDGEKAGKGYYINIAELNSVVPSFGITVDAPTAIPKGPYFDKDSTNIYYDLHLQPSWGFRVKKVVDNDESGDKSDVKINYQAWNEAEGKIKEEPNVDGAIYFNSAGFNRGTASKDEETTDSIKIIPSKSGKLYNGKAEEDIYDLSIQLPSIGNMMSDVWDIVHGPSRQDYSVETDKEGNRIYSLRGLLKSFENIVDGDIPYKCEEDGSFVGMTPQGDSWIGAEVSENNSKHNFKITHKTKFSDSNNPSNKALLSVDLNIGENVTIPYLRYDNAGHVSEETNFTLNLPNPLSKYELDETKKGTISKGDTLISAFNKLENATCMTITSDKIATWDGLTQADCMDITSADIEAWNALKQADCMTITSNDITTWNKPADWEAQEGSTAIINKPTNLITTDHSFTYGDTTKNLQDIITDLLNRISVLEEGQTNATPPTTE